MRTRLVVVIPLALLAALSARLLLSSGRTAPVWERDARRPAPRPAGPGEYERWARAEFLRKHPGEKPLNWAIAEAATEFYSSRPMGKFALSLEPGKWGNDCSDFVDCAVDEGLGVKARFRRNSQCHLLACDPALWDVLYWSAEVQLQPGDLVSVRHSPWYEPYDGAGGHVGVVGSDGMVYDFAKLRSWKQARYGRQRPEAFIRHSRGLGETTIWRLAPAFRYRIEPLPQPVPRAG